MVNNLIGYLNISISLAELIPNIITIMEIIKIIN